MKDTNCKKYRSVPSGQLHALLLTIICLLSSWCMQEVLAQSQPPNIVLIMADDLGWNDTEPYGNPDIQTPNIAALAREGLRFENMFTSTAMCAPTRQQIMTGMYPIRNGAFPNHSWVYEGVKSLPLYFNQLGYRTGLFGKTHFGPAASFPYEKLEIGANTDKTFRDMQQFMQQDQQQPFFLVFTSHEPHVPWTEGDPAQYNPDDLTVPPYLIDTEGTRKALSMYYAEISYLDNEVGKCLQALEASGLSDNTIVIFTTEQGPQFPFSKWSCYDMGLKTGCIIRWPGHIQPNTTTAALTQYVDVLPTLLEVAGKDPATIQTGRADAAGKQAFDGKSFSKVLDGKTNHHRDYVYGVQTTRGIIQGSEAYPIRSVRSDKYLYIQNLNADAPFENIVTGSDTLLYPSWIEKGKADAAAKKRAEFYQHRPAEELYDITKDPYQLHNLAENPDYRTQKKKLAQELKTFMAQQGDEGMATEMQALTRQVEYLKEHPEENNKLIK